MIELTQQELEFMKDSRAAGFFINEEYDISALKNNEAFFEQTLPTGRKILAVHHYDPDTLTIYKIEEALPEPIPVPIEKLTNFLNANPDVKALLNL